MEWYIELGFITSLVCDLCHQIGMVHSVLTRKWFPLQGELASLTKNVVLSY